MAASRPFMLHPSRVAGYPGGTRTRVPTGTQREAAACQCLCGYAVCIPGYPYRYPRIHTRVPGTPVVPGYPRNRPGYTPGYWFTGYPVLIYNNMNSCRGSLMVLAAPGPSRLPPLQVQTSDGKSNRTLSVSLHRVTSSRVNRCLSGAPGSGLG
eukprot:3163963-Rhodomonas_salina.1